MDCYIHAFTSLETVDGKDERLECGHVHKNNHFRHQDGTRMLRSLPGQALGRYQNAAISTRKSSLKTQYTSMRVCYLRLIIDPP